MSTTYWGFLPNDFINGEGVCVSLWVSGCPHKCEDCHNSHMWDFESGYKIPTDIKGKIVKAISANGIIRNFSILGGEPLCEDNVQFVNEIVSAVRAAYPQIKIFLWSGYTLPEIKSMKKDNKDIEHILSQCNVLIEGRYEQDKRDITLKLRGSSNQQIVDLREKF